MNLFWNYQDNENDADIDKEIAQKIKRGFIVKVYGILIYQIFITSFLVFLGLIFSSFRKLLLGSDFLYIISLIITFSFLFLPKCYPNIYQEVPMNYIALTIFTLGYSWLIALFTCRFSIVSVILALFLMLVSVVSLIIYVKISEKEFSIQRGALFTAFILFIVSCIISLFFGLKMSDLFVIFFVFLSVSVYILSDTNEIIIKGKGNYKEDDYILAAMRLYYDLIILFLEILCKLLLFIICKAKFSEE